ncbi:MAG: hypothetical protein F7B11_01670 [Caldisphaeraceae archaeon]|nr:hypothetical protein [Caldisphaeraceae archaeon]
MSDLRLYVKDKDREKSFVIHYGMGCRLVSAISEDTEDFSSLLKSAYEFDRGIYDIWEFENNEENYRRELEFAEKYGFSYVSFKPKPSREPVDAGIIEIYFSEKLIISNQSGDYIYHRDIRETWGYTSPHLDVGRFKKFYIPEEWTIIDKYFFGKPVKIEGEIDKELERKLWERVKWYKERGYKVKIL